MGLCSCDNAEDVGPEPGLEAMERGAVGGGDEGWAGCDEVEDGEVWVLETVIEEAWAEGMVRERKAERKEAKKGRVEVGGCVGILEG